MKNKTNQIIMWVGGVKYYPGDELPDDAAIAAGLMKPAVQDEQAESELEEIEPEEIKKATRRKRSPS
ncbi:MAG: hypothetical protein F6K24_05135 [Okeania sp. SIO2D1]|nr:hypothetical protein [Okeania sp. SIO2D1]